MEWQQEVHEQGRYLLYMKIKEWNLTKDKITSDYFSRKILVDDLFKGRVGEVEVVLVVSKSDKRHQKVEQYYRMWEELVETLQ